MSFSPETFGCQSGHGCGVDEEFQALYEKSGLECFKIDPEETLADCLAAQARLWELAQEKNCDYYEFVAGPAQEKNCPLYVLMIREE